VKKSKKRKSIPQPERRLPLSEFATEKMMVDLNRLIDAQQIETEAELAAFMDKITQARAPIPPQPPRTALEEAQDLMYAAWDEPDPERQVRVARQALEISADCADAYLILAKALESPTETLEWLQAGVTAGERGLGADVMINEAGHFWSLTATRPYIRVRTELARKLHELDRRPEAIAHYWELLRLNPSDNQGNRYNLLLCLLESKTETVQAQRLLALYPDEQSAEWLTMRALALYQRLGRSPAANQALLAALETYPKVFEYSCWA
jgi:tetratricopeptide (TPR) repeat protein